MKHLKPLLLLLLLTGYIFWSGCGKVISDTTTTTGTGTTSSTGSTSSFTTSTATSTSIRTSTTFNLVEYPIGHNLVSTAIAVDSGNTAHFVFSRSLSGTANCFDYANSVSGYLNVTISGESNASLGDYCGIVADPITGSPEAAYTSRPWGGYTYDLKYAYFDGTKWNPVLVKSNSGQGLSMACSNSNTVIDDISYNSSYYFALSHNQRSNKGVWSNIFTPFNSRANISAPLREGISYDQAHNKFYVSYINDNGTGTLSCGSGEAPNFDLQLETVPTAGGVLPRYSVIAVSPTGEAVVAYYDFSTGTIQVATKLSNGTWSIKTNVATISYSLSIMNFDLKLDSTGLAHLCYYNPVTNELYYGNNKTGIFVFTKLDDGGEGCSMAIGTDNSVNISYFDPVNSPTILKYVYSSYL